MNHRLDARLEGLAKKLGAVYSRYADDLTFSLAKEEKEERVAIRSIIGATKMIVADEGYRLHVRKKLHIRRRHQQQLVAGLVVNEKVDLPRETRRWLRAVERRARTGREATLSPAELKGWRSLRSMIARQAGGG